MRRPTLTSRTARAIGALLAAALAVAGTASPAVAAHGTTVRTTADTGDFALHPSSAGRHLPDGAVLLWANGSTTTTVDVATRAFRFVFSAEADLCEGAPELEVRIDGELRMSRPITGWGTYAVEGDWPPGPHHVSFRFTNDHRTATCDRNLAILELAVLGLAPDADPAAEVPQSHRAVHTAQWTDLRALSITPGAGQVQPIEGGIGVWEVALWANGVVSGRLDAQGNRLNVYVFREWCGADPRVRIRVDDVVVWSGPVQTDWISVPDTFPRPSPRRVHDVSIEYLNDYEGPDCDRNLRIRDIWFSGWV